jgi:lipoprotein
MKKTVVAVMVAMTLLTGCGKGIQQNDENNVASVYYADEVEYKEEHKEEIQSTVEALIQAYIGQLDTSEEKMNTDDSVEEYFDKINSEYDTCEYKDTVERLKEDNKDYKVTCQINYARDCFMVRVAHPVKNIMLKMTYDGSTITSVTDYE